MENKARRRIDAEPGPLASSVSVTTRMRKDLAISTFPMPNCSPMRDGSRDLIAPSGCPNTTMAMLRQLLGKLAVVYEQRRERHG